MRPEGCSELGGYRGSSADVVERDRLDLAAITMRRTLRGPGRAFKGSYLLKRVCFAAYLLVTVCVLLLVLEFVVRLAFPDINHQDTERSLFLAPTAGQNLVHWRPGAAGISFGEAVQIDEFGYRDLKGGAAAAKQSWLLIGDSVTFGVGVDAKDTFAGLLQAANPAVKVWNTAVVGYGVDDYLDVVKEFLAKPTPPSQVILVFCLNDPAGRFHLGTEAVPVSEKILGRLRQSKLYMLMKGNLTDRSKTYFANDRALYDAANPAFRRTIQVLRETHALLSRAGIPFLVVVLPYEYQLRRKDEGDLVPQRLLTAKLHELGIPTSDLYDAFAASGRPSGELFLYADAMHLSREGHELVFKSLASRLDTANRTQSLQAPRGNQ